MRPSLITTMMDVAYTLSKRSTCSRREVGCVILDSDGHVLSTGYNGVPMGMPHCTEIPCAGSNMPTGMGHDICQAVHAEQNALLQCGDIRKIRTCVTTTAPCIACVKLLLNTGCNVIVFNESYEVHSEAQVLWESMGYVWRQE